MVKYTFYNYYHELKVSVSQKYCVFYVCVSKNRMACLSMNDWLSNVEW